MTNFWSISLMLFQQLKILYITSKESQDYKTNKGANEKLHLLNIWLLHSHFFKQTRWVVLTYAINNNQLNWNIGK